MIVTRSGKKLKLEPHDLVPGDVCELTLGMSLPADLRIIDCTPDMEIDNSSLTGESEPQKRDLKPRHETYANLCFFGALVAKLIFVPISTRVINHKVNKIHGSTSPSTATSPTVSEVEYILSFIIKAILSVTIDAFIAGGILIIISYCLLLGYFGSFTTHVLILVGVSPSICATLLHYPCNQIYSDYSDYCYSDSD